MKLALRWAGRGVLVVTLLLVGLWVYACGRQLILRVRAERLLADVKALEVNKSSWADLQRFRSRWGKWGDYDGSCDATVCQYRVELRSGSHGHWYWWIGQTGYPVRDELLEEVGLRPAEVSAYVSLVNGRVVEKAFRLEVDSLQQRSLQASSEEGPRLVFYSGDRKLHPDHSLRLVKGSALFVSATPDEDSNEKARLMRFRLDCVNSFRPCRDHGGLLPDVYREFRSEPRDIFRDDHADCETPFWVVARDADVVLEGDVVSATKYGPSEGHSYGWNLMVRVTRLFKGKLLVSPNETVLIRQQLDGPTIDGTFPYKHVIASGWVDLSSKDGLIWASQCTVVEDTTVMRAQALQGTLADFGATAHLQVLPAVLRSGTGSPKD